MASPMPVAGVLKIAAVSWNNSTRHCATIGHRDTGPRPHHEVESRSKKAHIPALACAPKLIFALVCVLICAPKLIFALVCVLVCAPKLI